MVAARVRAPFPWFGGKQALAPLIVSLMPLHDTYVEVFGGAGGVLFAKAPSKLEVYNDLDSGLVNFFRVLRDPARTKRLQELLNLTPYARDEWDECRRTWRDAPDEVEMARRWFTALSQGFNAQLGGNPGWRYRKALGQNPALTFHSNAERLQVATARLKLVQVEHGDFERVLATFDGPHTLFYCDPPYLPATRRGGGYQHEMDESAHVRLLNLVRGCAGMVILSGYRSALYMDALQSWRLVTRQVSCDTTNMTVRRRDTREECIWIKPNAARRQLALGWEVTS